MLKPILMASAAQTADAAIVPARPQALKAAMCKAAPIKYLRSPHMYAYPAPAFAILNWMARPQPIPPGTMTESLIVRRSARLHFNPAATLNRLADRVKYV
jgi:hypothetical protein